MKVNQEKTAYGLDKVARYNWTMKNAPGEFLMIPKTELEWTRPTNATISTSGAWTH